MQLAATFSTVEENNELHASGHVCCWLKQAQQRTHCDKELQHDRTKHLTVLWDSPNLGTSQLHAHEETLFVESTGKPLPSVIVGNQQPGLQTGKSSA